LSEIPKKTKKSIRQYVQEDEIKFYIYLFKYSQQLKNIEEMTKEEILEKHKKAVQARLKRIKSSILRKYENFLNVIEAGDNDLTDEFVLSRFNKLDRDNKEIYTDSLEGIFIYNKNKEYVKCWEAPIDRDLIIKEFNEKRNNYIEFLENTDNKRFKNELDYVKNIKISSNTSKEKFGKIIMIMVHNLLKMPSFSSYTDNWSSDFYSNAVEKILLYTHNYDENILSSISGQKSKAFAYITQVCTNAFRNIINTRKEDEECLRDTISLSTFHTDGVLIDSTNKSTYINEHNSIKIRLKTKDILIEIKDYIDKIRETNSINFANISIKTELKYLKEDIDEVDKNSDYYDYIEQLENKINHSKLIEDLSNNEDEIEGVTFIKDSSISLTEDILNEIEAYKGSLYVSIINYKEPIEIEKEEIIEKIVKKKVDFTDEF